MPSTQDYVNQYLPLAQEASQKSGVPVASILAAGSIETGNGASVVGNNHFGIKAQTGVQTTDAQTGQPITQAGYKDAAESFNSYPQFLKDNSRYKTAFEHTDDPKAFSAEVAKAGYSERPDEYQKALLSRIDEVNKVIGSNTGTPVKSGKIVLNPQQRQDLIDRAVDPDEYQAKINKDIAKGGQSYEDAYRNYTLLNEASQTPAQKVSNDFNYKIAGTPTNQFINSWSDDFMKSWVNGWQRAVSGLKTAGEEALNKTGLESDESFEQDRKNNLNNLARTSLTLSPDANKDALNNPRAFIASVGNMAGTMVPLVTANLVGSAVSFFTAQPELEASIAGATLAIDPIAMSTSAVVGGLQFTGEAYNQAREKGLNHEQALTYSMIVGPAVGALGAFPVGELAGGLWKAARGAIADNAITTILDGNLTTAAFRDAQAEVTSSAAEVVASHAKNFGRVAAKDAIAGAAFNTIQGGMNDLADHLYGVNDPNKNEVKELFKDALQGAMFGALFAGPAMLHGASNESLYGFIDRNQAKPEKLEAMKQYASQIAELKGVDPAPVGQAIDEMHTVATKYGETIKDPDARFQIWQFGKESQKVAADSEVINHKLTELEGLNPSVTATDKAAYEEVRTLNAQKEQLINEQLTKIGSTKKPVNFAEYQVAEKNIQGQIDAKIKTLAGGEEEKPVEAPAEPDPFDQKQPEVKKEEPESDLDKVFGTGKSVEPKTVKDLLDIPITNYGQKGFLSLDEHGALVFTNTKTGSVGEVASPQKAQDFLGKPFSETNIRPEDVDQTQLKQKMEAEKSAPQPKKKRVKKEKVVDPEITEALKEPTDEQTTGIAESTATGLTELDKDAINEADQLIQGVSEVGGAENEGKVEGVEDGGAENKPVDEPLAENAQGTQAEGAENAAPEGDKGETDNKSAESNEQVKEDNGNEVAKRAEKFLDDHNVQHKIDTHVARPDFKLSSEELERGIRQIKEGNLEGAAAKKMLAKIEEWDKSGTVDYIQGTGGHNVKHPVPYNPELWQKRGGKPIESATVKLLDRVLKKAFPNIKTSFLTGEEFDAKHGEGSGIGVTNPDGTVDINTDKVTGQTQVHEMGHVWTSWAKKFQPELYKRGMELAAQETGIHEAIKNDGYDLEGTALHEETLARMIGESGESLVKDLKEPTTLSEKAKAWVGEMWQKLTNYVKNRLGLKDARFDNIKDMPFSQFTAAIARELTSGKEISPISSEEVASIEKDGISRYQLTNEEEKEVFAKPVGHIGVPLTGSSAITRGLGILRNFREILGNEADVNVTEDHVTKAVEFLGQKLNDYSDHILKNPDGSDKNLAGSAWIKQLAKEATTEKFRQAVKDLLKEQAATGKRKRTGEEFAPENLQAEFAAGEGDKTRFQFSNLSKDSQRIVTALGNFEILSDRVNLIKDRLFYNNNVIAFDPDADKVQTNKFVPYHEKLLAAASKNKWTKKAYKAATEYFLNVADQGTWAHMLDGNGDGMYSRGFRSYEKGVSAAFRLKQAASALIKPLTDISNEGLKGTLEKSTGATTKEVFKDNPFMPDIKLTNGELNSIYGILQAGDVQKVLNKEEGVGLEGIKPVGIKLRIQEFGDERKAQTITVYKKDFEDLKAHLGQERITKIAESATKTAEYLHSKENPVHESQTGLSIPTVKPEEDGTNFYYPRLNVAGNEEDLENYTKKQSYINDLTALKARDPKEENLYLVQEPAKVWDSRIRQGSEYSEMALPTHNMGVLMDYGKENMLKLEMNRYIDYNSKFQHDLTNPDTSGSPIEKYIISHFALATIGANPFVNLKHLSTIPLASGVIPMKYLAKNLANAPKTYAEQVRNYDIFSGENKHASPIIDEMKEHSDFANARINGFTSEVQLEAAGVGGKIRIPTGIKEGKLTYKEMSAQDAMIPLKTAETSFGAVVWGGAKDMVQTEFPHLKEGTPEYWNQVDRLYTDAIVASQPSFDQIHRPLYTKGGFSPNPRGVINKTLSLFSGQVMAAFNFGTKKGVDLLNNPSPTNRMQFAKAVTNIFFANAVLVAGVNMVRQKTIGSDADKTTYGDNFIKTLAGELPILGPILEATISKYQSGIYGQDLDYPTVGILNETAKGVSDAIKGKEQKGVKELSIVAAQIAGVPVTPFKLAAAGAQKVAE